MISPPRPSRSTLPEVVEIQIAVPPGFEGLDLEEVRAHFREQLEGKIERTLGQRDEAELPPFEGGAAKVRGLTLRADTCSFRTGRAVGNGATGPGATWHTGRGRSDR